MIADSCLKSERFGPRRSLNPVEGSSSPPCQRPRDVDREAVPSSSLQVIHSPIRKSMPSLLSPTGWRSFSPLGTSAGDLAAEAFGLDYLSTGVIFGAMIAAIAFGHYALKINSSLACVHSHPTAGCLDRRLYVPTNGSPINAAARTIRVCRYYQHQLGPKEGRHSGDWERRHG
jgi:hypothetical protein